MKNDATQNHGNANHVELMPIQEIVEGTACIQCKPRRKRDGTFEWTYTIRRRYEFEGEDKRSWFFRHASQNTQDIGKAIPKAIRFMEETDPATWLHSRPIETKGGV